MKIFYQRSTNKRYEINIFENKKKGHGYRSVIKTLSKYIDDIFNLENDFLKNYYLIDEKYFKFYSFNIFLDFENKVLDIGKLNNIIETKKEFVRTYFGEKRKLLYVLIDNVYVNSHREKYILGKSGKIFFDLLLIYIDNILYNILNKNIPRLADIGHIRPQSFFTIKFFTDKLLKRDFNILYFFDEYIKLIKIEKGFYKKIDILEFGYNKLISFLKEKDIISLFYRYKIGKPINFIGEKLIEDILSFYFSFIEKWILEKNFTSGEFIAIGTDIFGKIYISKFFNNINMIPFNCSTILDRKVRIKNIPIDIKTFLFYKS